MAASGEAASVAASTLTPYSFSETSSSSMRETSNVADQALTLDVTGWLGMQADYAIRGST
jgi:hypothetical protein